MASEVEQLEKELEELNQKLSSPKVTQNSAKYQKLSKKYSKIKQKLQYKKQLKEVKHKIQENKQLLKEEGEEMAELAEEEIEKLKQEKQDLIQKLKQEDQKQEKTKSAVIEIRQGTGGREAALFAADLLRMYFQYAENQGWKTSLLNEQKTSLGGYKEVEFEIENREAFQALKYESGVHRVQRVPKTEKSGRIHTSTATVAVLPQLEQPEEIKLNPSNLRIDTYRASGKGGQHVNRRETAVRITHEPSGVVASCQDERSQHKNKNRAKEILKSKLLHLKKQQGKKKIEELRQDQIGNAQRSEKIRTYNYPQDRITDHRIEKNWHNLEEILDGHLNSIIEALQKADLDKEK